MTHSPNAPLRRARIPDRVRTAPATLATALVGLGLLAAACSQQVSGSSDRPADKFTVERGDMQIRVSQAAEIQAFRETRVRSEVEGNNTVIFLIPEGREVKAGEKLVELDSSALVERKAKQEIDVARAESQLVTATKEYEIQLKQFAADVKEAENQVLFAQLDLDKFLGKKRDDGTREMGEEEQQTVAATSDIQLAESELALAIDKFQWSQKLADKGFITKNELDGDRLNLERRKEAVKLAKNKLDLLVNFTHVKSREELKQKLDDARLELERVRARGEAKLAQVLADKKSREAEFNLAKERLDNLEKQVKNCLITAPTDGLVVYAPQGEGGRRQEYVTEGAQVRERQTLIILPDVSRMIATLKVHESAVDRVKPGLRAEVRVDALGPESLFTGTVRRVAPLADSASRFGNPDLKVFQTEVEIDGMNTVLKPSMSARVDIIVAELPGALKVPITAVERDGLVQYLWVDTPAGPQARQVSLGLADNTFVQIIKGVAAGDVVYLSTPPGVQAPKYAQPAAKVQNEGTAAPRAPVAEANAAAYPAGANGVPREGAAESRPNRGPGGGPGGPRRTSPAMQEFQALLKEKRPDLAAKLEQDRAFMRSEEFRTAIAEDPELSAKMQEMMSSMMRGGQRPGGGPGGERGQPGERTPPGERAPGGRDGGNRDGK
ncbi:MAG: efflux RND transporter periplasmic adaptor subunit [Planctomycetes bacterium]|nr:efflux RND transporter periplasmic adaptor subunit [Planctomycetota bacterium]